jgi:hypothetical protein
VIVHEKKIYKSKGLYLQSVRGINGRFVRAISTERHDSMKMNVGGRWTAGAWRRRRGEALRAAAADESGGSWERRRMIAASLATDESGGAGAGGG